MDAGESILERSRRLLGIVIGLQPEPEPWSRPEKSGKTQGRVGGDRALSRANGGNSRLADPDFPCEPVPGQPEWNQKLFEKHFSGMDVGKSVHERGPLMIIADFGAVRVTVSPDETHAPLIVDPDAPLSLSQSFQTLQAVSGRNAQVLEASGVVQHSELAPGDSLDWGRQLARHLPFPDLARLVILKRRNHESNTIVSRKYLQAFVKLFRFLSTVRKQFPKSL